MVSRTLKQGATLGADKGYDTEDFVSRMKRLGVKAHVARKTSGGTVDGRTARGQGFALSLKCRKRIEESFGWIKTAGGLRKTRHIVLKKLAGQVLSPSRPTT